MKSCRVTKSADIDETHSSEMTFAEVKRRNETLWISALIYAEDELRAIAYLYSEIA